MKLGLTKNLEPLREEARARINAEVEAFRNDYLTPGSAQALVYSQKLEELERFARDEDPQPHDYPYLAIEADLYGMSLANAADFIRYFGGEWTYAAPYTERVRRAALVLVDEARSPAAIRDATGIDWTAVKEAIAQYHAA